MKKLILILFLSLGLSGCITLDEKKSTNVSKKSDVVSIKKTTSINQTKVSTSNNEKPNLSHLDYDTKSIIEQSCITKQLGGPVPYWKCLRKQLNSLSGSKPDLSHLDYDTKSIIEQSCITKQLGGPVPYWKCLRKELKTIGKEINKKEEVKIVKKELKKIEPKVEVKKESKKIQEENNEGKIKFIRWKCEMMFSGKLILTIGYFPDFPKSDEFKPGKLVLQNPKRTIPVIYVLRGMKHTFMWGGKDLMDYMIDIDSSGIGRYYNFEGSKGNESRMSEEVYSCKTPKTIFLNEKEMKKFMKEIENKFKYLKNL